MYEYTSFWGSSLSCYRRTYICKKKNFFNPREIKTAISGEKPICALPVSEVSGLITSLNIHYNLAYVFLFLFNLWLIIHRCNVVEIAEYETYV